MCSISSVSEPVVDVAEVRDDPDLEEGGVLACVGLGSNLGDCKALLFEAWQYLCQQPGVFAPRLSSPYSSLPMEMDSAHRFVNAAAVVRTTIEPQPFLEMLQRIEHRFGRVRHQESSGYQDRTLDLDLLLHGQTVCSLASLILPHPRMHQRCFVLVPLAEIVPQMIHPGLGLSIAALGQGIDCTDPAFGLRRLVWT